MMGQFTTAIYCKITGTTGLQTRASETEKGTGLKTRGTRSQNLPQSTGER